MYEVCSRHRKLHETEFSASRLLFSHLAGKDKASRSPMAPQYDFKEALDRIAFLNSAGELLV